MKKVSIIGSGGVGAATAAAILRNCSCIIQLNDRIDGLAEGHAMDIRQSLPLTDTGSLFDGSSDVKDIENSDFIIITAGFPRKEGMSRIDLLGRNRRVMCEIGRHITAYSPKAVVLVITNPVDHLTYYFKKDFPELNVFGFGCSLDSFRYQYFIAKKLNVNPANVSGLILGTHDANMFPYIEGTSVGGVPVVQLLSEKEIEAILSKTISAGTEIVQLLKTTGSSYTAGQIMGRIAKSIVNEIPDIFSVDVVLDGQMGFLDVALSLPCIIGKNGIEKVIDIPASSASFHKLKEIERQFKQTCLAHGQEGRASSV